MEGAVTQPNYACGGKGGGEEAKEFVQSQGKGGPFKPKLDSC